MGLRPDGVAPDRPADRQTGEDAHEETWTVGEAARTPAFWTILVCLAIPSMVGTGAQLRQISIMDRRGVGLAVAAAVFSVSAAVRIATLPVSGYVCDRIDPKHSLSIGLFTQAAVVLALLAVRSTATALLVGVLQGIKLGILAIVGGTGWPHYFGRRNLASILFGGYTQVILLMTAVTLAGAAAVFRLQKPEYRRPGRSARPTALKPGG